LDISRKAAKIKKILRKRTEKGDGVPLLDIFKVG